MAILDIEITQSNQHITKVAASKVRVKVVLLFSLSDIGQERPKNKNKIIDVFDFYCVLLKASVT